MTKLIIDAGTTWSKVHCLYKEDSELNHSQIYNYKDDMKKYLVKDAKLSFIDKNGESYKGFTYIFPSSLLSKLKLDFDAATGHMIKHSIKPDGYYENEVIALAYGAKKVIKDWENSTIVDLGSRDIKWIKFENGKYKDLDWNSTCGSVTGATVEMLCKFYNVDPNSIEVQKDRLSVTCGVFAMEKIMDAIASSIPAKIAIARYICGIAYNTWSFAQKPENIYLSGGFCENSCFIKSLELYCNVELMGRFLLLEGLY